MASVNVSYFNTENASETIHHSAFSDLISVLQLLLLALRHEVIQPAELSLAEDAVHQLPDKHQSQHLHGKRSIAGETVPDFCIFWEKNESRAQTIMGKTMAALEVLMTHSRIKQVNWMMVKRWTFLRGT